MDWMRRNPKAAAGLCALVVLCAITLAWGLSRGSGAASASSTAGPALAVPTTTPDALPTELPSASASASASPTPGSAAGLTAMDNALTGVGHGDGSAHSLEPHTVQLLAGADNGPLAWLGWRMPHAKGSTGAVDHNPGSSWSLTKTEFGLPAYSGLYTYVGEVRGRVWCTIKVDGAVVDHREARGPWGQVFCAI